MLKRLSAFVLEVLPYVLTTVIAAVLSRGSFIRRFTERTPWQCQGSQRPVKRSSR
jgi:hypothetical protein